MGHLVWLTDKVNYAAGGFVSFHGGLTTPDGQDYAATRGSILILTMCQELDISRS